MRPFVDGSAGAGLFHDNAAESWERWLEPLPDPAREDFAGWIFEAGNVVEVVVIELQVQGLERCLEVGEVPNPADGFIYLSADVNLNAKGMAVEPRASVTRGNIWQHDGLLRSETL